ncbi:MAG TPA: hypothetical protein VGF98_07380 [Candidatus Tumulicola sp.]|jgi:hypothetical protein
MKRLYNLAILFTIAVICSLGSSTAAYAEDVDGVQITEADVKQLLTALHTALKPNDSTIPLHVAIKPAPQMPKYASDWFYAGISTSSSGSRTMTVWTNTDLNGDALRNAITASFLVALSDGGYGGTAFKQLYDVEAARDAQLPSDAPNPYLNRQKLGAALSDLLK